MPKIINEKPPLPTLWVDTAVGIKLAKLQEGEVMPDIQKSRMLKLKELVVKLARSCKLLCPEGEQELEYWGRHLDAKIAREFSAFSRGIKMLPHQAVHDAQLFVAMEAYVRKDVGFRLPFNIYFHADPIKELEKVNKQRVFVTAHGLPPTLAGLGEDSPVDMHGHLEKLRCENVANRRTYAEQLALEQRAFVDAMVDFARSFQSRLPSRDIKPWEYLAAQGYETYFRRWHELTNKWGDWDGLCNFLASDHFCELPAVKISSQLYAKLVTDNRPIESGDSMDVKHLSLAIPVSHFVLTDRKMANRITELGIAKEWDAKVYSESTIDGLFSELEKIT